MCIRDSIGIALVIKEALPFKRLSTKKRVYLIFREAQGSYSAKDQTDRYNQSPF